ncbi:hypothetical protein DWB68_13220 [Galactobacter valiniphilus]|uniref:DUF4913 domain-containing protein n=1 Tax=Galactobacter valiniphilus TaxID=2676122 RepID=A0A399J746_9MICC|nr:hypothetical protein [Galactobacter valiniphilus]RII41298.1 hypothetical protein DWB68_13220 [Galactobacter valiniphilus]
MTQEETTPETEAIGTGELEDVVFELLAKVKSLAGQVDGHTNALTELTERIDEATPEADPLDPDPWNLREADDEEAALQWQKVAEWVIWFNANYAPYAANDLRIPECWYLHPHGRMLLLDLFYAWRAANYGHEADSADAIYWSTNYMPNAIRMAREYNGWERCTVRHEEERTERPVSPITPPVSFRTWLDRGDSHEPTPRTDQLPVVPPAPGVAGEFSAQAAGWQPRPWSPQV